MHELGISSESGGSNLLDVGAGASAKPRQSSEGRVRPQRSTSPSTANATVNNTADHFAQIHLTQEARLSSALRSVPMSAARTVPLLICSIGNPGSTYSNTLHSAGHTVLFRLAQHLGSPQFERDRKFGNGLVSRSGDWTLWQSTSYMNESGKGVRAAWLEWKRQLHDGDGKLVVIHDELEKAPGTVSLRTAQGASAKGHNGLKSIISTIGNTQFARLGIGIGRPVSRDGEDVARYVLKKMTPSEKTKIEDSVEGIIDRLRQLEQG